MPHGKSLGELGAPKGDGDAPLVEEVVIGNPVAVRVPHVIRLDLQRAARQQHAHGRARGFG